MTSVHKQLYAAGLWIQAIGTVVAAVGSTPVEKLSEECRTAFSIWGNTLQAAGIGLEVEFGESNFVSRAGSGIQALGNITVVSGLILNSREEVKGALVIKGNLLQALGGSVLVSEGISGMNSREERFGVIGNSLQVAGNSMQAIGGKQDLFCEGSGQNVTIAGSWTQALGAILVAVSQS